MSSYDLSIIIPTYNEQENIDRLIQEIKKIFFSSQIRGEIIVVDDNSTDDTQKIVKSNTSPNVRLVGRTIDRGLSQSVLEGIGQSNAEYIIVLDADFSHPVSLIPKLYKSLSKDNYDVAIGSRYNGGNIVGWPLKRKIISMGATIPARLILPGIKDPMSGFFGLHKNILTGVSLTPRGYKILLEILAKTSWKRCIEIPYTFEERVDGYSKLTNGTIREYLIHLYTIVMFGLKNKDSKIGKELFILLKFLTVGAIGTFINIIFLYGFTEIVGLFYLYSSIIAIEASILNNFFLNEEWTFHRNGSMPVWKKILSFHCIATGGICINLIVLFVLTSILGVYYIVSNFIGIVLAFIWNFSVNKKITWCDEPEKF